MHHCCLLMISLILALGLGACNSSSAPTPTESTENTVTLKPIPAVLVDELERVVDVVKSKIASKSELRRAQFVDANNGWASGSNVLFRTSDGGMNWKRLDPSVPEDSWITSFFFVDSNHGWLTITHKNTTLPYGRGRGSSILATSDGGDTWSEQWNSSNNSWIQDVSFQDAANGIAVGGRSIRDKETRGQLVFALRTNDGGKTWNDISEDLARAIRTPYMYGNDEGNTIRWLFSTRVFVLTTRGRVVTSDNSGKTWNTLVHFEENIPTITKSTLYKMLFDSKGSVGILAGSMGDEGYWANLITTDEHVTWHSYKLIRVPLLDAMFLSEHEILACGEEHKLRSEPASARPREGIIVHSKDNGKTWSPIYRTGSEEMLISLTKINETDFYAVSDIGNFIKFRLK